MRDALTNLLGLVGAICISVAGFLVSIPVGLALTGVWLIVASGLLAATEKPK